MFTREIHLKHLNVQNVKIYLFKFFINFHSVFFSLKKKGNWHYKYQETLEIHMKEKHQIITNNDGNVNNCIENETNCSYCQSNSVHPRLARGEQYPCGFKPYRCDLCLYSTTTKGNLAIHMQSDKHMNNCRDLSSPSLQQSLSTSSPENSLIDQTSQSQGLFSIFLIKIKKKKDKKNLFLVISE
jgi:hypothetical protein